MNPIKIFVPGDPSSAAFFSALALLNQNSFIQIKNVQEINLRVLERGVGETQACGSGACAAAVACAIQKGLAQELKINFHQGQVFTKVNLGDSKVMLQGSAEYRKQDVLLDL